ncbi:membrane anchor subunit of succinate dehydrogenase, Sdh4 [Phlyctochytrium planicorne]|nr:membrane anchor subunit of succinate dehydrogenase, Sdh4 [Phlyctochytrium planicorne]
MSVLTRSLCASRPTLLRSSIIPVGLHSVRIASFHFSRVNRSTTAVAGDHSEKSKLHGSYHWNAERALSLVTLPLIGTAFFAGSLPLVDLALGVVIPLHTHIGFDACIQDYIPHRKYGVLNTLCSWLLRAATALVLYGCYSFNTNDVGITAFFKRIWTGKL